MADDPKKELTDVVGGAVLRAFLALLAKNAALAKSAASTTKADPDQPYELTPAFGRFTTQNTEFKDRVDDVLNLLCDYSSRERVDRPLNILFAAAPGTGKSFLAKELSAALERHLKERHPGHPGVSFEEIHVAAFRTADDLLGVFQRVQSANLKGQLPFVLFDEVDGEVDGRYLLANFLAPMWDGKFYAGKDSYALGRAIFCFAASSMVPSPTVAPKPIGASAESVAADISYSELSQAWRALVDKSIETGTKDNDIPKGIPKRKDFIDRIDVMLCIPPVDVRLLGDAKAAQEYRDLAFSWIRKHFPQVERVEMAVLAALAKKLLSQNTSRRDAERSVFTSTTPSGNAFLFSNLPKPDQHDYKNDPDVSKLIGVYYRVKRKSLSR